MEKTKKINKALDKMLGKNEDTTEDVAVLVIPTTKVKKVKTTNEIVDISTKTLIIEDGRRLLL